MTRIGTLVEQTRRTRIFLDCVDVTRSSCLKTRPGNPPQTEHLPSSDRGFPCLNAGQCGQDPPAGQSILILFALGMQEHQNWFSEPELWGRGR